MPFDFRRFIPQDNTGKGILLLCTSMLCISLAVMFCKLLPASYSIMQIGFCRFLFGLLPLLPFLARHQFTRIMATQRLKGHMVRAGLGTLSMICFYTSVRHLPLAEAMALSYTQPMFITLLSPLVLKEKVGLHRYIAVGAGFLGILLICDPPADASLMASVSGIALGLAGAIFAAMAMITIRKLGGTEHALTTTTYFTLLAALFLLVPGLADWQAPDGGSFLLLVLIGLCAGMGQLTLTRSYQLAAPSLLGPFNYTSILWAVLFGLVIWNQVPTARVLAGIIVVVGSGIYILHRERVAKRREIAREVATAPVAETDPKTAE